MKIGLKLLFSVEYNLDHGLFFILYITPKMVLGVGLEPTVLPTYKIGAVATEPP